jgi:hypothetical protein
VPKTRQGHEKFGLLRRSSIACNGVHAQRALQSATLITSAWLGYNEFPMDLSLSQISLTMRLMWKRCCYPRPHRRILMKGVRFKISRTFGCARIQEQPLKDPLLYTNKVFRYQRSSCIASVPHFASQAHSEVLMQTRFAFSLLPGQNF